MANSVTFTIASSLGVEEVTLVQAGPNINATLNNGSVHVLTNACANSSGTQVTGRTKWWFGFVEEPVNLAISQPTLPDTQTTVTLVIGSYGTITGSVPSVDGVMVIAFVKACGLPPLP